MPAYWLPRGNRSGTAGLLGLTGAGVGVLGPASGATPSSVAVRRPAGPAYSVQTLHFKVAAGTSTCDIVGDLYTPSSASPRHRVPAILTTNGFGGSKDDQAGVGRGFAARGYAVLSYSGLGFGGSGCKITLDDPDVDGVAAAQLVSYLGGASGIAFTDAQHTTPAPVLDVVKRDRRAHNGRHLAHDPRVGMVGGSYGGQIQFAAAAVDKRIDTIVPLITWNDLSYSLGPNNTDQYRGVSATTPGAVKLVWGLGFTGKGVGDGVSGAVGDPTRNIGCPNFADFVCPALVTGGATGYFSPDVVAKLRHASVSNYYDAIRIPTLLVQGEKDTLFNLNEAAATFRALRNRRVPVKMIWQSWGHSDLTPAPGEINLDNPNPRTQYETGRVAAWFAHYLKGQRKVRTGPRFSYFRDWVGYRGNAAPAYASARRFPVGRTTAWFLSANSLVRHTRGITPGAQRLVTPPAGAPTSIDTTDVLGAFFAGVNAQPRQEGPGTSVTWASGPLARPLKVVGSPVLNVRVDAPLTAQTQAFGPAGDLVLFPKLVDIAPDGTTDDIAGNIAPIRVPDVTRPVRVTMAGVVHRFAKGHRLGLVLAGGSQNYRGGLVSTPVTIAAGAGQVLRLPVVR